MNQPILHQLTHGIGRHDAVSDHALLLQSWLRELGFQSEIYTPHIETGLIDRVQPLSKFRPQRNQFVIYHHSIGSEIVEKLAEWQMKAITIYHNITPAEFFEAVAPSLAASTRIGRKQLHTLKEISPLALPVSAYNQLELDEIGFPQTRVLPLTFNGDAYNLPLRKGLQEALQPGPLLLFVGRISPHKRQEDLIKLLACYRRINPQARLALVGNRWMAGYVAWLEDLASHFGVGDAVELPGLVSQQDLVTYYRSADLYISMSEHEGVGKPFLESMYLDLPILAYAASATPYTLGRSSVLFYKKDFERLAELTDILINDQPLRRRIINRQHRRIDSFSEKVVKELFRKALEVVELI